MQLYNFASLLAKIAYGSTTAIKNSINKVFVVRYNMLCQECILSLSRISMHMVNDYKKGRGAVGKDKHVRACAIVKMCQIPCK